MKQENRRAAIDVRHATVAPFGRSAGHDALATQCEVSGDANPRSRSARPDQRFEHLTIPIGRFNKDLRPLFLARILFKFLQFFLSLVILRGQIAVKGKVLA